MNGIFTINLKKMDKIFNEDLYVKSHKTDRHKNNFIIYKYFVSIKRRFFAIYCIHVIRYML